MDRKRGKGESKAQSLQAIGEALAQTYRDVVEQDVPPALLALLDDLARGETGEDKAQDATPAVGTRSDDGQKQQ